MRVASLFFLLSLLWLPACKTIQFGRAGVAPAVITAQAPGTATGAGATLVGPTNAAAPTTQVAELTTNYFPPEVERLDPKTLPAASAPAVPAISISAPRPPRVGAIASTVARTSTTIGQHQSATGIVKAAADLESMPGLQKFGIALILAGLLAIIWSLDHDKGYPIVYWKVVGIGFVLQFVTSPWWLALLLIPIGFYAAQRMGLIRIPIS